MGLIIPKGFGPSWGAFSHNIPSTIGVTLGGTTITASGTTHTKGSVTQVLSALPHDVEYIIIGFSNGNTSAAEVNILVDLVIDPAGGTSWDTTNPLIPNLLAGFSPTVAATTTPTRWYHFPVRIPKGASVGMRSQSNVASRTVIGHIIVYGQNRHPGSWWSGQRVVDLGTSTATSAGTNHTGGNSSAFGSWTNFGSTLGQDCGALQLGIQGEDASTISSGYEFQVGVGSNALFAKWFQTTTAEVGLTAFDSPHFFALPAGTQLQVRARADGTAQAIDLAIYTVH